MKFGRNDPCWCGSGKKYKKCHLDRDKASPLTTQELIEAQRKLQKKLCLHPDASQSACEGHIVRAHTIQRNGGLSRISRDYHVYTTRTDLGDMIRSNGDPDPKLEGVRTATTFTGFCEKHDRETFRPIEVAPFQACQQHAFLLGYRAVAKEFYAKQFHVDTIQYLREVDKGASLEKQFLHQTILAEKEKWAKIGLRDSQYYKSKYDKYLLAKDYSSTKYAVIHFNKTPEILCSGGQFPEFDFIGGELQNYSVFEDVDNILSHITFSSIPTDTGGAAVFTWFGEDLYCERLVKSLLDLEITKIPNAIFRYMLECYENVAMSPDWWENLDEKARRKAKSRIGELIHNKAALVEDGIMYTGIEVVKIESNI